MLKTFAICALMSGGSIIGSAASMHAPSQSLSCESLRQAAGAGNRITSASHIVPNPTWPIPASPFLPARPSLQPVVHVPFCRIEGQIEQAIGFELWLPDSAAWNGRLLGAGVGGSAGVYNYSDLARGIDEGFAAATTDSGHKISEKTWMLDRTKEENYAYRAEHLMTEVSKKLVQAYYGKPAQHSYFIGCSGGGRQALKEMQRFPSDYNGIVAGAPGPDMPALSVRHLWTAQYQAAHPEAPMGDKEWQLVSDAAIRACDTLDGVKDGVLTDPRKCHFDPSVLECRDGSRSDCLSPAQIDVVRAIYAPIRDENGRKIDSGLLPGVRTRPGPAPSLIFELFGQGVHHDPNWDPKTFDIAADLAAVDREMPELKANDPNVQPFRDRGGKIILYQGWMDPSVIAQQSLTYYGSVARIMGGDTTTQTFMRLFMVPGMFHCAGGPGADHFGGAGSLDPEPDADHGCLAAIVKWVEQGTPPAKIIASKIIDGKVVRTRPLCPYPESAQYKGGDPDNAASFACEQPAP